MRLLSILFLLFGATSAIAQNGQPVQNPTNTERPIPLPVYTSLIRDDVPEAMGRHDAAACGSRPPRLRPLAET